MLLHGVLDTVPVFKSVLDDVDSRSTGANVNNAVT